jgi:hypothetical protein
VANPSFECVKALVGNSDGTDSEGNPITVSLRGVNFGSASATRYVYFGKVDVTGQLIDCCPVATRVDVSYSACGAGLVCSDTLLQFRLPEGAGVNVRVSVEVLESEGRRLSASVDDSGLVTFSPLKQRHSVSEIYTFARRRNEQSDPNNEFSYAEPVLDLKYGSVAANGKFYPPIYDFNGNQRTTFPRSGCFDDDFSRDPDTLELICNNPVLLRIGGRSLGSSLSAEGIIQFRDPSTEEVVGVCNTKCSCPLGGLSDDCGWSHGCKQSHDEIICQVSAGKGTDNLVVAIVGGLESTYESSTLYFSYDGPIVERVYLGTSDVVKDFDITIAPPCDPFNVSYAEITYTGEGEERPISTRYQQYLRNYGQGAYVLSYNALGFESTSQLLEIYGRNFGREESPVFVTLNGKACADAKWNDGEDFLGSDRFPSYITCKAPRDVTGPKSAVVSVNGQNWTQEVLSVVDEQGQTWFEGSTTGVRLIPQSTSEDYVPAVYLFNSICKNDTLLYDERGTPSLDIYYARPDEECVQCPVGANCFALGYLDPISSFGFWKSYYRVNSEEAKNDNIGCPEERLGREEGTCPVFQACLPLESCEGNNKCAEGYDWQLFACDAFYTKNPDRQSCTTDLDCRCGRDSEGNVDLNSCIDVYTECKDSSPEKCSMCVEGTCTCRPASRCSLCTAREFFRLDGKCEPCPQNVALLIALFFVVLVLVAVGGYFLNKKQFNLAFISIGVDYFQVLAIFATSDIEWPQQILDLFRLFSIFNFNIDITAPECVVPDLPYSLKWSACCLVLSRVVSCTACYLP